MFANDRYAKENAIVSGNLHEVRAGTAQKLKLTRFLIVDSYRHLSQPLILSQLG